MSDASVEPGIDARKEEGLMKTRSIAVLVAVALAGTLTVGSTALASSRPSASRPSAPSAPQSTFSGIPVTGTCTNNGTSGTFTGTLDVIRFVFQNGRLFAVGSLTGTCSAGGSVTDQQVRLPVRIPNATCQILDLVLGPLHLDLLGLVIDLNRVHLQITAEQGPGNLLGNLLCAIAHLLDHNRLDVIAPILNAILLLLG
jgi:hypothetical protein